jgi:dTDP-4-amino-4,6-dideoxygalactose transaminase
MPNSDKFTDCLLRLPFYYELSAEEQYKIIDTIKEYAKN